LYSLALEMLHEKLQSITTSSTSATMKVQWLIWWNSSTPIKIARKFLKPWSGKDKLTIWLAKANWYAEVRDHLFFIALIFYFYYIHTYSNVAFSLYSSLMHLWTISTPSLPKIISPSPWAVWMVFPPCLHTLSSGTYVIGMQLSLKYSKDISH
jgi:hypothetical protein